MNTRHNVAISVAIYTLLTILPINATQLHGGVSTVWGRTGIQTEVSFRHKTITKVYSHSPAGWAGLKKGDKIVLVNGYVASPKDEAEIRGLPNTLVTIVVERGHGKDKKTLLFTLLRVDPKEVYDYGSKKDPVQGVLRTKQLKKH